MGVMVSGWIMAALVVVTVNSGCRVPRATQPSATAYADFTAGSLLWLEGEPRRALARFVAAAAADPGASVALHRAADCLVVLGQRGRARRFLERARRVAGVRSVWFDLARVRILSGRPVLSSSMFARTSEDFVRVSELWHMAHRSDREVRALRTALRLAPDDLEAMIRLGWWARRRGRARQALDLFRRSVASHPEYLMGYVQEAFAWIDLGRYDKAWQRVLVARQQAPANLDLALVAWRIALAAGRIDWARTVLASLTSYHGSRYVLFRAHRKAEQGRWQAAAVGLMDMGGREDTADAAALLLRKELRQHRPDLALSRLGGLVGLSDGLPQLGDAAQQFVRYGFCREALIVMRKNVRLPGNEGSTWRCRHKGYRVLGRAYLEAFCGDRAWAQHGLDRIEWWCGVQRGLGYLMMLVADRAGWVRRAVRIATALIGEEPDDATALNLLGYLWANRGRTHQAVKVLRIAHLLDPLDPAVADSYGWALLLAGRHRAAESLLVFAWTLLPSDGEIAAHRGWSAEVGAGARNRFGTVSCRSIGGIVRARRWYRQALQLGVGPHVRRWVRNRLAGFEACHDTQRNQ